MLENALNVSPSGAAIEVRVQPGDAATVELSVSDRGPGLSDADKARATTRFWRGSTTGSGTRLGLAIVEALAQRAGGTLALTDTPGGGLTVTVTLIRR